jgi:hypothetical protein
MITIFVNFLAKKMVFVFKTQGCVYIFTKISSSLNKNANIFVKFFGENVLRIITSVQNRFIVCSPMLIFEKNKEE